MVKACERGRRRGRYLAPLSSPTTSSPLSLQALLFFPPASLPHLSPLPPPTYTLHTAHVQKEKNANNSNSRPGILVLINDADWELEGGEAYLLQTGDNILFVSTLHGG